MEYVTKTRLPLHSNGIIYLSSLLHNTPNWYNPSLLSICTNREKSNQGLSKFPFLEINAKGGEEISGRVADCTRPKSLGEEGPKCFVCLLSDEQTQEHTRV
jgi:hypothetical protein